MNSAKKGRRYERKIGKPLAAWWGVPWDNPGKLFHPTPQSGGFDRVRTPGDLIVPDDFPFCPECKDRQGWTFRQHLIHGSRKNGDCPRNGTPLDWLDQAREACPPGKFPLLVMTRRRWEDYLLLPLNVVGFIEEHCGRVRELARFNGGLRLYTLDQLLELDPDALGRRRD
jgi:hypothetical protein